MRTYPYDGTLVVRLRQETMQLSRRMRHASGTDTTLTPSRFSALSTIDTNNPLRMTDLARAERVSKSSITRIVARLSNMGLVESLPDPTDGRSTLIGITPKGKQVLAESSRRIDEYLLQQLVAFSDAERALLWAAALLFERMNASK